MITKETINELLEKKVSIDEVKSELFWKSGLCYFKDFYDSKLIVKALKMYKDEELTLKELIDWFDVNENIICCGDEIIEEEIYKNITSSSTIKQLLQRNIVNLITKMTLISSKKISVEDIDKLILIFIKNDKMIKNIKELEIKYAYLDKHEEDSVVEEMVVLCIDHKNKAYAYIPYKCYYEAIKVVDEEELDYETDRLDLDGYTDLYIDID